MDVIGSRLWERFELANINDRIENIYQHFLNQQGGIDRDRDEPVIDPLKYQSILEQIRKNISNQLSEVIKDAEDKYNEKTKKWRDETAKLKSENQNLRITAREANSRLSAAEKEAKSAKSQYDSLRSGLDKIINEATSKNQEKIKKLNQKLEQTEGELDVITRQSKKVNIYLFCIQFDNIMSNVFVF